MSEDDGRFKGKIFILTGKATCGKDTFAGFVKELIPTAHYSIVDPIRAIMKKLPKDTNVDLNVKDEKLRKLTSDIKLALEEYSDYPYRKVKDFIEAHRDKCQCVFVDMREKHNIDKLKKDYGAKVILIKNDRVPEITSNVADANIHETPYDLVIENNGTLEDLRKTTINFIKTLS